VSLGFLAFVPFLWLALIRRRASEWAVCAAAIPGGPHPLSAGVDFAYGFDAGGGTSFWMVTGSVTGNVSLATLQAAYPGAEAFAWVGVTNAKGAATGHVLKVNGAPAAAYVNVAADGTASAR
jgi:hypothetical protein